MPNSPDNTNQSNRNNVEHTPIYAYVLGGSLVGLFLGSIVGLALEAAYANYSKVACDVPGHEDGGTHYDGDYEWHHDGPNYKVYASEEDSLWYLFSSFGGMGLGIVIAVTVMVCERFQASQQTWSQFLRIPAIFSRKSDNNADILNENGNGNKPSQQ